ncbi:uncharacterized protein A4U43_C03F26300 [Asparagus officinalis]|uniref:Vacuolar ATPase assembly integral membrane protein VMA21 homolog n=1 Tax=Asparagus officinalis TaxID=4686 RepID=A0A5P1FE21_ASPOF|nr:uncharacterized protein LOC109834423 [Asparagus officinalis]XP_020258025.1 uncharacterized protein LOC109834423 [Asparagus officinalis]ONK76314.1 uncharacterized protein A4U43_C03F26300 [Asparagus officinalis]
MSGVMKNFFVTSMVMWAAPVLILYSFNYQIFPGISELSSSSKTLLSGFLAVISVNLVIAYYIYLAMKEKPHNEAQPDPTFVAAARASITQQPSNSTINDDDEGNSRPKEE